MDECRLFLVFALVLLVGCEQPPPLKTSPAEIGSAPRASVALKVLVVNDPKLAESIDRLRGEWAERSGGTLSARSQTWDEVSKVEQLDADVLIFPASYLGELVDSGRLRPMRAGTIGSQLYKPDDVLPLVRDKLGSYGGRVIAFPLSVVMPLAGLAEGSQPDRKAPVAWWPTQELTENWPAIMLLARAASSASHPQQESVLFDPQSMAARIAEPPFVRALEEWQEQTRSGPMRDAKSSEALITWTELPASDRVFNRSTGEWEAFAGSPRQIPLLAGGELLAVTSASKNAASAFELAAWLASPEVARQLGPIGKGSLPVRQSLLGNSARWIDLQTGRSESAQIAPTLKSALGRDDALVVPRIPGAGEYLAALDAAVRKALHEQAPAAEVLAEAAREWDRITDTRGRDSQRRAYLKDLGIEVP